MKAKYPYTIEKYDGDGIFECDYCHTGVLADLGFDVYAYMSDRNNTHRKLEYFGSYCQHCAEKLYAVPKSVSKPKAPTYNDIIHSLSNALKLADDEPVEADALAILESSIQDIIDELQSQSPSQTPSP